MVPTGQAPRGVTLARWQRSPIHGTSVGMSALVPQTCEVEIEGKWRQVSLTDAVGRYAIAVKRCPACHGRVSINGVYCGPGFNKTMMHRKAHSGCPLKPDTYCGTPSLHPQALT